MNTLVAEGLSRRFGETYALRELDLGVESGSVLGLLGPNGAGKTTTINLFLGLLAPTSGRCSVDGIDVDRNPAEARQRIGYVPETVALYPELSGLENLRFFSGLAGQDLDAEKLGSALERSGLQEDAWHRRVRTYSKGMRQKVGIAIAVAKEARALLLDEPASGLDPKASNELSGLVKNLASDGIAILMATHDLFRAREACDQLVIMRQGSKVAELGAANLSPGELETLYLEHMHG